MNKLLFLLPLILFSCNLNKAKKVHLLGETQGTYYSIVYFDDNMADYQMEIDSILHDFDMSVSLWVPNSILSKINDGDTSIEVDKYFADNFVISKDVANQTNGAFDFTIGKLIKAWGFGYDNTKNVDSLMIDSLLQHIGYQKVKLVNNKVVRQSPDITFDFNAVAQGYSVDVIGDFLQSKGIENYLIDIGGEVKAKGQKPDGSKWKVGVEKPAENKQSDRDLRAVVELKNLSIATSGNYRKYYIENGVKYSHEINPHTGYPARNNLLSASIVHKNTAYADAYATACLVMGLDKSIKFVESHENTEAFFIYSDTNGSYKTYATKGFQKLISQEFK